MSPNDKLCHQVQPHIKELEQYSRWNSIRIFEIEKPTEIICRFSKQKPNVNLQPHIIDRCHTVGNYRYRNTVLVKFISRKHKQETLRTRRPMKGSDIIIVVNLTRTNYEV